MLNIHLDLSNQRIEGLFNKALY